MSEMFRMILPLGLLLTVAPTALPALGGDSPRERISLNAAWQFQREDPQGAGDRLSYGLIKDALVATGTRFLQPAPSDIAVPSALGRDVAYTRADFDDSGWRKIDLPHDWGITGPFNQEYPGETAKLPWWGVGWYRRHFTVETPVRGGRYYLDVDGAMSYAAVWCNGQFVGGWPYGYSSFRLDLTPFVKAGADNVLAIRLDNPNDSSRWYPGGGLYRNVWLVKTAPVQVAQWGTFITTPTVSNDSATVAVKVEIENHTGADATLTAQTTLFERTPDNRRSVPVATSEATPITAAARATCVFTLPVKKPKLWSIDKPNLYLAVTTLEQGGHVIDRYETVFGIRTIQFTADTGFLLNGQRVPIQGVCNHHDLGALGAAFNTRAAERQLEILKEMGVNAVRSAHNPPAPELLELCDRMGILVMDEFTDTWTQAKKPNGYARLFADWAEADLRAMIRRDRNHPSIILWSIGNEVGEQRMPELHAVATKLAAIVHDEDKTRPATSGCDFPDAGHNGFQKTVDVFSYNYKPHEYKKFREQNPAQPLYGSETASCISSRGEYAFPVSDNKDDGKIGFQMSSYDLYAPGWAMPPDVEFKGQDENPSVAGEFVWTGFDYLGEPTPFNSDLTVLTNFHTEEEKARAEQELKDLGKIKVPSRSSYFGIVDLAGFKKDRFYLYQARWRPELPMAHILPHWNWPEREGQVTPVHVYTSGDEAELFLNGQSQGRQKKAPLEYRLRWNEVKYQPGELKVVAYKAGKPWAEETVITAGPAAQVKLEADRTSITADGRDLSFITVTIADKDGRRVPRSMELIQFEITGPGEIAAVDNGDATSFEPFQASQRKAFNGLALVIVRAKPGAGGTIQLKATSGSLKDARVSVRARRDW